MRNLKIAAAVAALTLGGCVTGIVAADRDTYLVSATFPVLGFQPPTAATANIYGQANEFCHAKGKQVDTIHLDGNASAMGRPSSATLQFRCVIADDSAAPKELSQPAPGQIDSMAVYWSKH